MKLTQLFLCSATLALPLTLNAATQKSDDRWFDVEIILFSQLGDKSQSKEHFPETSELPKYRRVEDLLSQYLNPDIRSLKQLLPRCDSPQVDENLVQKHATLPAIFTLKPLGTLESLAEESFAFNEDNQAMQQRDSEFNPSANDFVLSSTSETATTVLSEHTNEASNAAKLTEEAQNAALLNNNSLVAQTEEHSLINNEMQILPELSVVEREKIQALVLAAENEFQALKFEYSSPTKPALLCKMDERLFTDYQANNASFDYDGFTVDKVPLLIDGKEEIKDNHTHLLSKDSLQLDDIIKDLRYSKNFRPLLHMGWRQVARPEKESIPVKVYAGDNFAAEHKKQLAHYNKQKNLYIAQTKAANNAQNPINIHAMHEQAETNQETQLQTAKRLRIQEIIGQLATVSEDTEALLTSLEAQDLSLKLINQNPLTSTPPKAPVQPWFIDGFFKIHLQHYLFITADFNILDKSLSEIATVRLMDSPMPNSTANIEIAKPIAAKAIRFKQDRRVISGEVHYFDHPYMGMIVQIRPYTKPAPEEH